MVDVGGMVGNGVIGNDKMVDDETIKWWMCGGPIGSRSSDLISSSPSP